MGHDSRVLSDLRWPWHTDTLRQTNTSQDDHGKAAAEVAEDIPLGPCGFLHLRTQSALTQNSFRIHSCESSRQKERGRMYYWLTGRESCDLNAQIMPKSAIKQDKLYFNS
ncbi:hypothetical protein KP509_26G024700 [Ceratopteris richardii]|uniref:Uncharacterized protein n=1 Tax=Ceratopteris richardii TaxID=49495 RepID=A0A8T2RIZ8_CERRI|nr:hypothetical protein KP509_26G024700 [Ceratopteris richardii]